MDRVRMLAPAKVNLLLAVGGLRADGYHDVTTVMAALELADEVTIERAERLTLVREPEPDFAAQDDLTWRAAEALSRALGREPGLRIALTKRIPAAGGLGGGSSDAAAVLAGACLLWGVDPSCETVTTVARELGADVAFFMTGGVALLGDRGDRLIRRLPAPGLHVVLVNPGVESPTSAVYRAFDADQAAAVDTSAELARALSSGDADTVAGAVANNLEQAAVSVAPAAADVLADLRAMPGVSGAWVSGSGSTVFAIVRDAEAAGSVAAGARAAGLWAAVTRIVAHGVQPV